jgi:hypothetical protein
MPTVVVAVGVAMVLVLMPAVVAAAAAAAAAAVVVVVMVMVVVAVAVAVAVAAVHALVAIVELLVVGLAVVVVVVAPRSAGQSKKTQVSCVSRLLTIAAELVRLVGELRPQNKRAWSILLAAFDRFLEVIVCFALSPNVRRNKIYHPAHQGRRAITGASFVPVWAMTA